MQKTQAASQIQAEIGRLQMQYYQILSGGGGGQFSTYTGGGGNTHTGGGGNTGTNNSGSRIKRGGSRRPIVRGL